MKKGYKQGYKQGQKDTIKRILGFIVFTGMLTMIFAKVLMVF